MSGESRECAKKVKISLDSSCLNANKKHPVLNQLDALENKGSVILFTSSTILREQTETQKNPKWLKKYRDRINELEMIMEPGIIGIARIGLSSIARNGVKSLIETITDICFPGKTWNELSKNKMNDVLALVTTSEFGLDYFLTSDIKDMISNGKTEKLSKLGIKIRIPEDDFLKEIKTRVLHARETLENALP